MREFLDVVVKHTMWEPYKLDGSRNICVRMLTQSWNIERSQKRALPLSLCLLLHKNHSTSFFTLTTSSMESAPLLSAYLEATKWFFFGKNWKLFFAWVIKKVLNGAIMAMKKLWLNIVKYFTILKAFREILLQSMP